MHDFTSNLARGECVPWANRYTHLLWPARYLMPVGIPFVERISYFEGAFMRKAILIGGLLAVLILGRLASTPQQTVAQEGLPAGQAPAPEQPASLDGEISAMYSYSIGFQVGSTFHADGAAFDIESLLAGLKDGLSAAKPKYEAEALDRALQELGRFRMQAHVMRNREFLEKNKQAEGVQVLPSGLQYKVLASGTGASPGETDRVKAHYSGKLIDGTVFDSSYERNQPFVTVVNEVIPGWSEALQKMKVGDKWQLVIPSELGYGETGAGGLIPPHSTLIFDVELLEVE
jgi:FKBP-type peptidyl-prolyl cis-trans isomerase FklB